MNRAAFSVLVLVPLATLAATCAATRPPPIAASAPPPPPAPAPPPLAATAPSPAPAACSLRVHFYDVGQGLAALVDLPDGRHVLVDTGDGPRHASHGPPQSPAHAHLLAQLRHDLGGAPLDLLWITHQHGDHLGGVPDVAAAVHVGLYVDNGRDGGKAEVDAARTAATAAGARLAVVDPDHRDTPLASSASVRLSALIPTTWPPACSHDPNDCSIGLRVDACASSVLFTGDAEAAEEPSLDLGGPAGLLQVGHHGSDTSSTDAFLARAAPRYAVISAGHEGEGANQTYCHPRAATVKRLTRALGGAGSKTLRAFEGRVSCRGAGDDRWADVPASDRLWATERDGDVVLVTNGGGDWARG